MATNLSDDGRNGVWTLKGALEARTYSNGNVVPL